MTRMARLLMMPVLAVGTVLNGVTGSGEVEAGEQSSSTEIVAQIKQMEQERIQIGIRKDMEALAAVTSNDYMQIDWVGTVIDKATALNRIKSSDMQSYSLEDMNVRVYGSIAIATGTAIRRGVTREATGDRDITGRYRYTRVYAKLDGRWQVVHFQQTRLPEPRQ